MKTKYSSVCILLTLFLLLSFKSFAQPEKVKSTEDKTNVKTNVFTIDMCNPDEINSIKKSKGRARFEVNWQDALSFGLENTNQFKYDYKINSVPFASFVDTSYASFSNSVKSSIDFAPDPFFTFEIKNKPSHKVEYLRLSKKLDSIRSKIEEKTELMMALQEKHHFLYGNYISNGYQIKEKVTKEVKNEYNALYESRKRLWSKYNDVKSLVNDLLALSNQKELLKYMLDGIDDSTNEKHDSEKIYLLKQSIDNLPINIYTEIGDDIRELRLQRRENILVESSNFTFKENRKNQAQYLEAYQHSAQLIRILLSRFEAKYDKFKNILLIKECKNSETIEEEELSETIKQFFVLKEALTELQNLYTGNPLEDNYLEEYLGGVNKYVEFLSQKFTSLQKVVGIHTVHITPTSSNMKNYDYITVELEKTNKLTKHTEKYSYDIYIRGGLKVDFSAGIFATSLINHDYTVVDSLNVDFEPTNKKMVRRVGTGDLNIGFGGMVNVTKRTGASWLAPGVSFGLILSTQPSLQFASSLTLAIGKTERLLIHAGYAMGFVKRVDGIPLDENIPAVRIGDDVRTIDKFLVRPFFGLTYNLSKNKVFKATSFKVETK